jgi:hypothetical protein
MDGVIIAEKFAHNKPIVKFPVVGATHPCYTVPARAHNARKGTG